MEVHQKLKIEVPHDWAISLLSIYSGRTEISTLKKYQYFSVHYNTIHNSQEVETTLLSMNTQTDKENEIYTYAGILFHAKKEGNPAIRNNMDEPGRHQAK